MKRLFLVALLFLSSDTLSLSYAPPHWIEKGKETEYGVKLDWTVGEERTSVYISIDENKLCKIRGIILNEHYHTIGAKETSLVKVGSGYPYSFSNEQEYEYIVVLFFCEEWSQQHFTGYFGYKIGGGN